MNTQSGIYQRYIAHILFLCVFKSTRLISDGILNMKSPNLSLFSSSLSFSSFSHHHRRSLIYFLVFFSSLFATCNFKIRFKGNICLLHAIKIHRNRRIHIATKIEIQVKHQTKQCTTHCTVFHIFLSFFSRYSDLRCSCSYSYGYGRVFLGICKKNDFFSRYLQFLIPFGLDGFLILFQ